MGRTAELRVPDIGDVRDVPVVEILVAEGDRVAVDDTVVVVESDKATLDVPSTVAGRVSALKVAQGDPVSAGTLLLTIEVEEDAAPKEPAEPGPQAEPAEPELGDATAAPSPQPVGADPAPPAAALPAAAPPARSSGAPVAEAAAMPATPSAPADAAGRAPAPARPVHASPSVRKTARELGVDPAALTGTGPKGRLTKADVQAHVKRRLTAPAPVAPGIGAGLPPWPQVDHARFGPVERRPLSRLNRISGPALARNWVTIPHVTSFDEADVTELEAFREAANAEGGAPRLSLLPFVVKAAAAALKAHPRFNASLDGDALVLKRYCNIGVAVDAPEGLVVPVVKEPGAKGLREIAAELAELAASARAGRLRPQEMAGASFTISSLGGVGGTAFTPIVNAPEVAILGLARAAMAPVWDGRAFQPRLMQPLCLSWDHRAVDGVAAARFLVGLRDILADFRRISL